MEFKIGFLLLCLATSVTSVASAATTLKLTPQQVVERAMQKGTRAREAEIQALQTALALDKVLGDFDWVFGASAAYQHDSAQATTTANLLDKTTYFSLFLNKKIEFGTQFTVGYDSTIQNSMLSTYGTTTRRPDAATDILSMTVRQPLLQNSFGYADRQNLATARDSLETARWSRSENLETVVLEAMQLYWNAYIAQEQLKSNLLARDKYVDLVKSLRRKAGFNLSSPGELPRVEAELQNAEGRVKSSSAGFITAEDELLTSIKLPPTEDVQFVVPQEIPALPKFSDPDVMQLRTMKVAELNRKAAQRTVDAATSQSRAQLDLVGKAKSTGAEEFPPNSRAEMLSGTGPTYYIGLEFKVAIDSSATKYLKSDAMYKYQLSELAKEKARDAAQNAVRDLKASVTSQFAVATSWVSAVGFRERVVREMEASYRQGRSPLIELIRAYNDLFSAQLERARAVGQYHIYLNQLAAAVDELIVDAK